MRPDTQSKYGLEGKPTNQTEMASTMISFAQGSKRQTIYTDSKSPFEGRQQVNPHSKIEDSSYARLS